LTAMKAGTRISDFGYDSRRDFGIDVLKAVSAMMVVVIHCWLELYVAYPITGIWHR